MSNKELIFEINQRFKLGDIFVLRKKKNRLKDYEMDLMANAIKVSVKQVEEAMNQLYDGEIKMKEVNKEFLGKVPRQGCTLGKGVVYSRLAGQEYKAFSNSLV